MKPFTPILCGLVLLSATWVGPCAAVGELPARYQNILEKKIFGSKPAIVRPDPSRNVAPTPLRSWAEDWRLVMLVEEDDGTIRAGLVNVKDQSMAIMNIGEQDPDTGISLVEASYKDESGTFSQNGQRATLNVPLTPLAAPVAAPRTRSSRSRHSSFRRSSSPVPTPRAAPQPIQPRYTGAELDKHLKDYQMEVIRKGLPPLPVPLTKEMDKQLVKEGVLPPQEAE